MNNWKLINGTDELFDLDQDLEEMNNLYQARHDKVEFLRQKLNEIAERVNHREKVTQEGREGPTMCL